MEGTGWAVRQVFPNVDLKMECLWGGERRLSEFYSYLRVKSWSCCGIQTLDFGAFLAQPGCRVGRHDWGKQVPASCRHDWHQTDSLVVVTIYGQIPLPAFNWVKASQTES